MDTLNISPTGNKTSSSRTLLTPLSSLVSHASKMALRQLAPLGLLCHVLSLNTIRYPMLQRAQVGSFKDICLSYPIRPTIALSYAIYPRLSSLWSQIWDSVLRAVPKKKTSHRKKRQRFMAGKALKDVTNLNTCSACGSVKRAHLLCPYCVEGHSPAQTIPRYVSNYGTEIRSMWKGEKPESDGK